MYESSHHSLVCSVQQIQQPASLVSHPRLSPIVCPCQDSTLCPWLRFTSLACVQLSAPRSNWPSSSWLGSLPQCPATLGALVLSGPVGGGLTAGQGPSWWTMTSDLHWNGLFSLLFSLCLSLLPINTWILTHTHKHACMPLSHLHVGSSYCESAVENNV